MHTNLSPKHSTSNGNSKWLPKRYIATSFKGGGGVNSYLQIVRMKLRAKEETYGRKTVTI